MSQRSHASLRPWTTTEAGNNARRVGRARIDKRASTLAEFDADAWMTLLTEQRLRIAAAAGVDPSRVTIRVGH